MQKETIVVLDFGGQYNQLIARRVREAGVYSEVLSWETPLEEILEKQPKGIIFTGGPAVVFDEAAPTVSKAIFEQGIPVLGICYGAQLLVHLLGGSVEAAVDREYGKKMLQTSNHQLFKEIEAETPCWMSHTYQVKQMPEGFAVIGKTDSCPVAALANDTDKIYGVQFHPEVVHTPKGSQLLKNFLFEICACSGDWKMSNIAEQTIQSLKEKIGDKKVLLGLSGGVDSSVAAALLDQAIGDQLTCIFVDNGLLRKNEADEVVDLFTYNFDLNLVPIDARQAFLSKLKNVSDPEEKRKNIGETFIRVFEAASKDIGDVNFLAQGTIYPDVVESGTKNAAVIKSHHNVGGLPDVVDFEDIVEPLRDLFKDEVRALGRELGLPDFVVDRQPFPGPGLAIRIIGNITEHKLDILREADFIYREEIKKAGLTPWQYFAVLTNLRTVGVMGDERTYHYTVALRAVESIDGMTADWFRIPHDVLAHISNRIVNEVEEVNRVVYDISSKPPATIEWE